MDNAEVIVMSCTYGIGALMFILFALTALATFINDHSYPAHDEIPVTGETQMHDRDRADSYLLLSPVNEHTPDNERREALQTVKRQRAAKEPLPTIESDWSLYRWKG